MKKEEIDTYSYFTDNWSKLCLNNSFTHLGPANFEEKVWLAKINGKDKTYALERVFTKYSQVSMKLIYDVNKHGIYQYSNFIINDNTLASGFIEIDKEGNTKTLHTNDVLKSVGYTDDEINNIRLYNSDTYSKILTKKEQEPNEYMNFSNEYGNGDTLECPRCMFHGIHIVNYDKHEHHKGDGVSILFHCCGCGKHSSLIITNYHEAVICEWENKEYEELDTEHKAKYGIDMTDDDSDEEIEYTDEVNNERLLKNFK